MHFYQEFSAVQDEIVSMSHLYNRLKKICNSGSSIGISAQSWKELEKLWALLENLVKYLNLETLVFYDIQNRNKNKYSYR